MNEWMNRWLNERTTINETITDTYSYACRSAFAILKTCGKSFESQWI